MSNSKKLLCLIFFLSAYNTVEASEKDSLRRIPIQLTFVSPLGTNGSGSGDCINNVSVNILWGTSGGLNGVELGGLMNHSFGEVKGLQAAGFANCAGGPMHGIQLSGLCNMAMDGVVGVQAAGIVNSATLEMKGVQLSGIINRAKFTGDGAQFAGIVNLAMKPYQGFQMAGIANINMGSSRTHQFAGLLNLAKEPVHGAQVSGLINLSHHTMDGLQVAGLMNLHAGQSRSLQMAGLLNRTKTDFKGAQVAGLLNMAQKVSGLQLGLINIADTVESGVPIGIFSVIKHGYRVFEVETNESLYLNMTFKMGVQHFYTIYTVGFRPQGSLSVWAPGIGVGTCLLVNRKLGINIDGITYQVNEGEWWTGETNLLNKVRVNTVVRLTERFSILAGISMNVTVSKVRGEEGEIKGMAFDPPVVFYKSTYKNAQVMVYPGLNIGIQF